MAIERLGIFVVVKGTVLDNMVMDVKDVKTEVDGNTV